MPLRNIVRDKLTRLCVSELEVARQALRLIANDRANTYPKNTQLRARIELQKMPKYTRPTAVHSRCIESGRTRGHVTDFKVSRIVFREKALAGEIPGVRKSCW
ncbi:40S ribosomal protein mrp2, mitochondrial [Geranomyces variabilis]|nr:40S ribosomal protein mrp2, mitochondrial [Geranomyces variabilis]KAJ3163873.1 40S ribosomal protein mrp2, mitochondrial [Geranomyces variabilis]